MEHAQKEAKMAALCVLGVLCLVFIQASSNPLTLYKDPFVVCPDNNHECSSSQTCCVVRGGKYGCCPKVNAVCCPDLIHCCPSGYTCGTSNMCQPAQGTVPHPLMEIASQPYKEPLTQVERASRLKEMQRVGNFVCPDRESMCPDGDTCCPIGNGKDGCCPKKHAVCCSDKIHCCPEGHTCGNNGCLMGESFHPMLDLSVSRDTPITCPNEKDQCSAGSTCCQVGNSTTYGCCPKENAVCCGGGSYCCPAGHTCSEKDRICRLP